MEKIIATDENIRNIVASEIKKLGLNTDLNHIDVSRVTNMSVLFFGSRFNGNISKWDVSNVTNMEGLFYGSIFNNDISEWDVSRVTNMRVLFFGSKFNGNISKWDVSNVTNMEGLFYGSIFNNDISKWDVSRVTNMSVLFFGSKFNSNISKWDVSNVTNMKNMFPLSSFNGDISEWDVSRVTNMKNIFTLSNFNGYISSWKRISVDKEMIDSVIEDIRLNNIDPSSSALAMVEAKKFFFPFDNYVNITLSKHKKILLKAGKILPMLFILNVIVFMCFEGNHLAIFSIISILLLVFEFYILSPLKEAEKFENYNDLLKFNIAIMDTFLSQRNSFKN